MQRCVVPGRVTPSRFINRGEELEDDDPAVISWPQRFVPVDKPAKRKAPAKKKATAKKGD